jgi:hypothetical protein
MGLSLPSMALDTRFPANMSANGVAQKTHHATSCHQLLNQKIIKLCYLPYKKQKVRDMPQFDKKPDFTVDNIQENPAME